MRAKGHESRARKVVREGERERGRRYGKQRELEGLLGMDYVHHGYFSYKGRPVYIHLARPSKQGRAGKTNKLQDCAQ